MVDTKVVLLYYTATEYYSNFWALHTFEVRHTAPWLPFNFINELILRGQCKLLSLLTQLFKKWWPTSVGVVVDRHERLQEPHVLRQVGEQPEPELAAGEHEEDAEDDVLEEAQTDDEDKEAGGGHRQVVHALAHHWRPQREQADGDHTWNMTV